MNRQDCPAHRPLPEGGHVNQHDPSQDWPDPDPPGLGVFRQKETLTDRVLPYALRADMGPP